MPAARPLLAAAAVTSAALVLAACGADGSSVGPASTAQTLTPVTTVAAAPAAPATTQAQTAPATTTSTQEEPSSSSSSSTGSSAAPSSSVTTAGPVAQAPVGGGNADCGSTAGGFVRRITTDADCATAVKVASGAADTVPYITVTNLARTMRDLKERGVWIIGTSDDAEKGLYEGDFTGPTALVMGSEGEGMRRLTRETCDVLVNIPMFGSVESLNVSVASGICLFEARRQRTR